MVTLQEIEDYLEVFLETNLFSDYCENGLQFQGKREIGKIGTAVSASLATIEKAAEQGVDALLVHHGLFWNKDSYAIRGVKQKKLSLLFEHGISVLAYHLPLDAHKEVGNNWRAAEEMGWSNLEPFCEINGNFIGVRGEINPCGPEQLRSTLEKYYAHPAACALGGPAEIKKVALVSGGARCELVPAAALGCDAYITGNFDEPQWNDAHEEGIHFFAMGHSATERIGPRALGAHLEEKFGVKALFLDIENPF